MSPTWWPGRRKAPTPVGPEALRSADYRSPGLSALVEEVGRRHLGAILDLGPPSTQNVRFLSHYSDNIAIQDLFRSCRREGSDEDASFPLIATGDDLRGLPSVEEGRHYDLVFVWDLLHYLSPDPLAGFCRRVRDLCGPGALVFLLASNNAPIPPTPIHFKIVDRETLRYGVPPGPRSAPRQFTARGIEQLMTGFRPLRSFQLRTGLQEFVLVRRDRDLPTPPRESGGGAWRQR